MSLLNQLPQFANTKMNIKYMLNLWRNDFGKSLLTLIVVYINSINIELQVFNRSEKHTNTTPTQVNRPKIIWKEKCLPEDDLES